MADEMDLKAIISQVWRAGQRPENKPMTTEKVNTDLGPLPTEHPRMKLMRQANTELNNHLTQGYLKKLTCAELVVLLTNVAIQYATELVLSERSPK